MQQLLEVLQLPKPTTAARLAAVAISEDIPEGIRREVLSLAVVLAIESVGPAENIPNLDDMDIDMCENVCAALITKLETLKYKNVKESITEFVQTATEHVLIVHKRQNKTRPNEPSIPPTPVPTNQQESEDTITDSPVRPEQQKRIVTERTCEYCGLIPVRCEKYRCPRKSVPDDQPQQPPALPKNAKETATDDGLLVKQMSALKPTIPQHIDPDMEIETLILEPALWDEALESGQFTINDIRTALLQKFCHAPALLNTGYAQATNAVIIRFITMSYDNGSYAKCIRILINLLQRNLHYMQGYTREQVERYDKLLAVADSPAYYEKAEEYMAKLKRDEFRLRARGRVPGT